MKNTALLIIDFQNDYFSSFENAKFPLKNTEEASLNTSKILEKFRENNLDIIHIQHESLRENSFFQKDTKGFEIHESVKPIDNEKVVVKNFPNSFKDTNLKELLDKKNIQKLIITGAMTHMCIDATVRAANDFSYDCVVIKDATATKDLKFDDINVPSQYVQASFMAALEFAYAKIVNTKEILKDLDT